MDGVGSMDAAAGSGSGAGDVVDPGLQRRGNVEVDEAGGEDHGIGGEKLVEHGVGNADDLGLAGSAGLGRRVDARCVVRVDMRQRIGDQIAHDKRVGRIGGNELLGEIGGDAGRVRSVAARAGRNEKNRHGGVPLGLD